MRAPIDFYIAEVVENQYTYKDLNKSKMYGITVRTYNSDNPQQLFCIPSDSNIKKIPLTGEHVFIYKGLTPDSNNDRVRSQWYYMATLPLQSSIHQNSLPTTTKVTTTQSVNINSTVKQSTADQENIELGQTFTERGDVPILQPFEGDILVEGRFGNSIRLGSSHGQLEQNRYSISQLFSWDGRPSQPLIILSNKRPKSGKSFSVENIKDDYSSLYLTSGQEIKTIEYSKELSKSNSSAGPEFIGSADKMILQSKSGPVIIDAKKRLSINANEVLIGSEQASSPIPKGDVLEQILTQIISAIQAGTIGPAGIYSTPTPGQGSLAIAQGLLRQLNSKKFYIDKE